MIIEEIQLLNEEVRDNKLYGYHDTENKNVTSIELDGFKIGSRSMQGKGVYSFLNLTDNSGGNAAIGYGQRHMGGDFSVIKFEILNPSQLLILDKKIAEDVFGQNGDIISQLENHFGSYENYQNLIIKWLRPEFNNPEYLAKFKIKLVTDFNGKGSKELMFGTANLEIFNKNGVIYDGEYGMQYLIKNPSIMKPLCYYEVENYGGKMEISNYNKFF